MQTSYFPFLLSTNVHDTSRSCGLLIFRSHDCFEECVAATPFGSLIAGCRRASCESSYRSIYVHQVYDESRTRAVATSSKEEEEISKTFADIDVAKLNHFASDISSDGGVFVEPFKVSSDFEDFRSLSLVLDKYDREQLLVGLESTAHYGQVEISFLISSFFSSQTSFSQNIFILQSRLP